MFYRIKYAAGAEWILSKVPKPKKNQPPEIPWKWKEVEEAELPTITYKEIGGHRLDPKTEYSGRFTYLYLTGRAFP